MRAFGAILSVLLSLFVAPSAFAAYCDPKNSVWLQDLGWCIPVDSNSPVVFVQKFYGYGLGFISGVALIFIILGGYTILSSQGSPVQVTKGKSYIIYSLIGLVLAGFGFIFMSIVGGQILKIPGIQ